MKMHCPHCGVKGSVDDSYVGRKIRCPKCQETFRCQADEEISRDVAQQEPIPPLTRESPAPSLTDEKPAVESLTEVVDESSEVLEQPDHMDDPTPVTSQDFDKSEESEEAEVVEDEPAEAAPATESFPDLEEDKKAEEIKALLAGEVEAELVEEASTEPAEERASPEVVDQEPSADTREAVPEKPDEQESLRFEDDNRPPVLEPTLLAVPAVAVAAEQAHGTTELPAASGRFAQGMEPRTDFTMGEALNEAWQYTKGAKGSIWAAVGMMYLVMLILGLGLAFMQAALGVDPASAVGIWAEIGVQSLVGAISTLFTAGLMYIGVRRAAEKNFSWNMVFVGFPMALKLLIASILMTLLVISGFVLLVLPGIYLAIGYTMALPLMIDRQLDPWQAMEASRKAIHKVWWKVSGLFFVMGLIYLVSAIPLGIGLIWAAPMSVILVGVVYRYLFGAQAKKI